MSAERKYLTTVQAAEYCGYSKSTLEKLRCHGGGPTFLKPLGGRRVFYLHEDLDDWLMKGRRTSTSDMGPAAV